MRDLVPVPLFIQLTTWLVASGSRFDAADHKTYAASRSLMWAARGLSMKWRRPRKERLRFCYLKNVYCLIWFNEPLLLLINIIVVFIQLWWIRHDFIPPHFSFSCTTQSTSTSGQWSTSFSFNPVHRIPEEPVLMISLYIIIILILWCLRKLNGI